MSKIKTAIQNRIHNKVLREYEAMLIRQKDSYNTYYMDWNNRVAKDFSDASDYLRHFKVYSYEEFVSFNSLVGISEPYILFCSKNGQVDEKAYKAFFAYFESNKGIDVAYAHEDWNYSEPWFKPEYSQDTLLSFFYFGSIFAVRTSAVREIEVLDTNNPIKKVYDMVLKLTDKKSAGLVDYVLYHSNGQVDTPGYDEEFRVIKDDAINRRGIEAHIEIDEYGYGHIMRDSNLYSPLVSIIIPSKDHPDVLGRCIESIRRLTNYESYEIIVVDNGSSTNNRALCDALSMKYSFTYCYEPMDFNFSKMCNMGASKAKGEYFLLLNDDMEILSKDWLTRLVSQTLMPNCGAVGAKLLYPDTSLIQHVGITNMYEGPAHKLLKEDDTKSYYHGHNRADYNLIGVTAACLLVSKDNYYKAGAFDESFRVAYNDVDFCFSLVKLGLNCVIRNDVVLYHHESLSRGDDNVDEAKRTRLRNEGDALYNKHPDYYDYDPYYSKHLTGVSGDYACSLPYENRNIVPVSSIKKMSGKYPKCDINETLIIGVDHAHKERHSFKGQESCYIIDVHAHVRNLDSVDYSYRMILKSDSGCYEIPCVRRYRPDVERIMNNQCHVELSGFVARIPERLLPKAKYELWMEARSVFSRQVLCNKWSGGIIDCL